MTPLEFIMAQVDIPCDRNTALADLGLDSLSLLQLQIDCEKQFGKRLTDAHYAAINTVGELVDALR